MLMANSDFRNLQPVNDIPDELFSTRDPSYSPEKFYTRSVDDKGHAVKVTISIPPPMATRIAQLVQSGQLPSYKTVEDFGRDSFNHRMQFITEHFNVLSDRERDAIIRERALIELQQIAEQNQRQALAAEMLAAMLKNTRDTHDKEAFLATIQVGHRLAESCTGPWKEAIKTVLKLYQETLF
jgi:Arc/MetJ-type ribon-helix-helix transcriptional regulator